MKWMNIHTGEILTTKEMEKQFKEEYDGGDPTNPLTVWDHYEEAPDYE